MAAMDVKDCEHVENVHTSRSSGRVAAQIELWDALNCAPVAEAALPSVEHCT